MQKMSRVILCHAEFVRSDWLLEIFNQSEQSNSALRKIALENFFIRSVSGSVTRLGDILDFGQLFKAFGNN